jgi:antitoxin (DNA-binding transcriptional repressor) of toxin-antitoxin stability system
VPTQFGEEEFLRDNHAMLQVSVEEIQRDPAASL